MVSVNEKFRRVVISVDQFFVLRTAPDGEVMEEFYNENGRHKDTKYYYGKTSESK